MATGGKLEVQIGADKTDFDKKIKEVESDIRELSKVKLDQLKLGLDTKEINAQIKDAKNNLSTLKDSVRGTATVIGKDLVKQTGNGSNALMQFSRIAQDAPYGIIGIGNNITATVEAFGHLKNSTGTAGGALKAMASSLMGTGGILLGVSLLTTGFTLLAQSGLSVGDIIDKVTGKFDAFGAALKKSNEEAVKNSAAEISGMNALVSASKNVNLSMQERIIAVKELQSQYPAYFGNLTNEQILNGNVKSAVEGVTNALIAKAKAQAYTGELVKLSEEEFKLQEERSGLIIEQTKLQKGLQEAQKNTTSGSGQAVRGLVLALSQVNSSLKNNQSELNKNAKEQSKWTSRINESVAASISLKAEIEKPIKTKKAPETFNTPQVSGIQSFITPLELTPVIDTAKITSSMKMITSIISEESVRAMEAMLQFNENINAIIEDSFVSTFGNLGTVIGDALASGANVLEAVGNSLMASLGNLLSSLGTELIKLGTAAVLAGTVVKLFGTVSGIGAGLLAIAGGTALKGIGAAMSKGANDRANGNTSTATGQGANNTSTTSGGGTGWSGGANGTVVFEIAGTSLIGVLNNTTERNLRIGGR